MFIPNECGSGDAGVAAYAADECAAQPTVGWLVAESGRKSGEHTPCKKTIFGEDGDGIYYEDCDCAQGD